jgi:hypothetical protein
MKMIDYEYIIEKTINALTHPGELMTDGECMDEVWVLLESKGYDLDFTKKVKEDYYNTYGEKAYKKEYL